MIAPETLYPTPPLTDLRDLLSLDPELLNASPETIAERLGLKTWLVEMALEALVVEGEVLA